MRVYKSGTRWCAWRWTDVVLSGRVYLRRLHLVQVPWFSVMLHWIRFPDPQRDPHCHPVTFLSVVLRGGYTEWRSSLRGAQARVGVVHRVRWWNFVRATDVHKILTVEPGTLTLVFAGPVVRRWGFWTSEGWISWRDYRAWK